MMDVEEDESAVVNFNTYKKLFEPSGSWGLFIVI